MTRKRFIKKLMAHGVSRNDANLAAAKVATERASYEDRYLYTLCEHFGIDDPALIEQLQESIVALIPIIVDAISEAAPMIISEIKRIAAGAGMFGYL